MSIYLINGPWNGRLIQDLGTVTQKMVIYACGAPTPGTEIGYALYEPNVERTLSFWSHNVWEGILEGSMDADDLTL